MYKTVRHGENSLQYTILPQEDGGAGAGAKPRKARKKGKTAAILTVTVVLVCGIIATAVLVPLLLTSDLVVLPAAFQKFSVSSLHRSHSGNHVVVVAKKPHGWVNSHRSLSRSQAFNKTYNNVAKPQDTLNMQANATSTTITTTTTSTAPPTTTTTKAAVPITKPTEPTTTTTTTTERTTMSNEIERGHVLGTYDETKYIEIPYARNYLDISTTTRSSKGSDLLDDGVAPVLSTETRTTSPPWWPFPETVSYVRWSGSGTTENMATILCGAGVVAFLVIVLFVWVRRRRNRSNDTIKNSTDSKADDKDTLLKESTAGSEEE